MILDPTYTEFLSIPFPSENCDPFWNQYQESMRQLDEVIFMNHIKSNLFMSGGGTRSWNGITGLFSWTDDFIVPVYHWGKKISIRFGTDNLTRSIALTDGDYLYITIPFTMNDNVVVNFKVATRLDVTKRDEWIVGWRNGAILQLRSIGELI